MGLFKNKKVEKVNEQLEKMNTKKAEVEKAIVDIESALDQTVELFAMGEIGEKDIEEAHEFLKERRQELADIERMVAKVVSVKNKVKIESVPMVSEWRNKQAENVQAEVGKAVKEALQAREAFVKALAKVGQARNKINAANSEYNDIMRELGERTDDAQIDVPSVYPEIVKIGMHLSQIEEKTALGLSKATQEAAVYSGTLPQWVGGDSK